MYLTKCNALHVCITNATSTTSTVAMQTLLNIVPLDNLVLGGAKIKAHPTLEMDSKERQENLILTVSSDIWIGQKKTGEIHLRDGAKTRDQCLLWETLIFYSLRTRII